MHIVNNSFSIKISPSSCKLFNIAIDKKKHSFHPLSLAEKRNRLYFCIIKSVRKKPGRISVIPCIYYPRTFDPDMCHWIVLLKQIMHLWINAL